MTDINRYLVETGYMPEDDAQLRVFDDIELVDFLRKNIEQEHYSGDSNQIHGIYRYDAPGKLAELYLVRTGEERDSDDHLDWTYELKDAQADRRPVTEAKFTVRIDGRA